jgi:hypothetical protein
MRLLVSRLLIGLLVSGWLSIDFGRGTAKLALELIPGLLEFSEALADHFKTHYGPLLRSLAKQRDDCEVLARMSEVRLRAMTRM